MTARNGYDWSPLDLDCDPIPGDHDAVSATARQFKCTAQSLENAAGNLRRLRSGDTCSEAVTKILKSSSEMASQLDLVRVRYEAASTALANYAPVLCKTQAASIAALDEAGRARQTCKQQETICTCNYDRAKAAKTPQEQQHWLDESTHAAAQRNAAAGNVADAKRRLQAAIDERNSAAESAATQIEDAVSSSPVNDSGWDKFKHLMKPAIDALTAVGKWVWDHIDEIALVLTIAAVALSWVPGLGEVLAVAATIARGLAWIKFGIEFGKKLIDAGRKRDWGEFGRTLLFGGGELLLAKYGGKAITKALEKRSGVLASKAVELGQQSVKRFNSVKKAVVRTVSNLRNRPFVAPRPINPRWLDPEVGARGFSETVDRFLTGKSLRSMRNHPDGVGPLEDAIGPPVLRLRHPNLHDGIDRASDYVARKGAKWLEDHTKEQRTEVQTCP